LDSVKESVKCAMDYGAILCLWREEAKWWGFNPILA